MRSATATASTFIAASTQEVWHALTDPTLIREYFMGATVTSDWTVGDVITWSGEWSGHGYADKGLILALEPHQRLSFSHWSALSGTNDDVEHRHIIDIRLVPIDDGTEVILSQANMSNRVTPDDRAHRGDYESNWREVLRGLREVVERDHVA